MCTEDLAKATYIVNFVCVRDSSHLKSTSYLLQEEVVQLEHTKAAVGEKVVVLEDSPNSFCRSSYS